jgi:ribosome-binding ATPase YchF (GTP1/OBG family)
MYCISKGTTALEASTLIDENIRLGFICGEVIACLDVQQHCGISAAKLNGKMRQVGKQYEVSDGDIIQFVYRAPMALSDYNSEQTVNKNSYPVLRT